MSRYRRWISHLYIILIFTFEGHSQYKNEIPNIPFESIYDVQVADSIIQNIISQTNIDTLVHYVNILSGEDSVVVNDSTYLFHSRNALHSHNELAADFIFQTLIRFGLPVYNQKYSETGRNVYAVQTGTAYPDQKYIICAHYDDVYVFPFSPGADDNASGTAAVLEAARILSSIQTPYSIIFAFWDEEEIGIFGSAYFAQVASQLGENILGVLNLDMIGWDSNNDGLTDIHSSSIANSEDLANLMITLNDDYQFGLSPIIYNPGTNLSDHASFWNQGLGAVLLIEAFQGGDFTPYYHTSNDKIEHFNLNYFHAMSKLAIATISYLSFNNISTSLGKKEHLSLSDYALEQNYPNPFSATGGSLQAGAYGGNPSTTIKFLIPKTEQVKIEVYNSLGQQVATLINKKMDSGSHEVNFYAQDLPSGIYVYKMSSGPFRDTKKMLIIK